MRLNWNNLVAAGFVALALCTVISMVQTDAVLETRQAAAMAQEAESEPPKKEAPKQEVRREIQRFRIHLATISGDCRVYVIQDHATKSEYLVVPGTGICPISKPVAQPVAKTDSGADPR